MKTLACLHNFRQKQAESAKIRTMKALKIAGGCSLVLLRHRLSAAGLMIDDGDDPFGKDDGELLKHLTTRLS